MSLTYKTRMDDDIKLLFDDSYPSASDYFIKQELAKEPQGLKANILPSSPSSIISGSADFFGSESSIPGSLKGKEKGDEAKTVATSTASIESETSQLCDYLRGSSVADTPAPSPNSDEESGNGDKDGFVDIKPALKDKIPEGVRLPQRKGGMQLWQFLYTILEDQYLDLIQYTTEGSKLEFRLLEPDAVAIWWGHQKNRPNMNYDKLSRSLRYYYDKKIIQKVNGERYVYRFCCDPEYLYEALGNSEARPKLKEMPEAAKRAMDHSQIMYNESFHLPSGGQMLRALSAEQLASSTFSRNIEMNALPIHVRPAHEVAFENMYTQPTYNDIMYQQAPPPSSGMFGPAFPQEWPGYSMSSNSSDPWACHAPFPTPCSQFDNMVYSDSHPMPTSLPTPPCTSNCQIPSSCPPASFNYQPQQDYRHPTQHAPLLRYGSF